MNEPAKAKRYETIKLGIGIAESVLLFALLLLFVLSGNSALLRNHLFPLSDNPYIRLLLFSAVLGAGISLVSFPFQWYGGYLLEKQYHLSSQSFISWLWEKTKAALVGIVLAVPLLLVFYYFLLHFPRAWWFWMGVVLFFFSVFLGRIAPQVIFPIFYKFEPLDDENLLQRLRGLAAKVGFQLQGVYRFNLSKTTQKANAAFTGLGKSKRIILGDTLLDKFSAEEIEAVFAHEAGHFAHKHLLIGIVTATVNSFFSLYLAAFFYRQAVDWLQLNGQADLAALPLLSLILSLIALILNPLNNALSRFHERQADLYALKNCTNPRAFISAMQKLSELNLIDRAPHPLVELLFHSHPSMEKRIALAEKYIQHSQG